MKTPAAILIMGILLFNGVGYRLLNAWLLLRSNRQMEVRLDQQQYDESQLLSVKIPATHLAYCNNSSTFERVDGQITINGIPYQYVNRRIFNDSIEFRCIPNQKAIDLQRTQQKPQQGSIPATLKNFMPDLYVTTDALPFSYRSFTRIIRPYQPCGKIPSIPLPADERPPAHPA